MNNLLEAKAEQCPEFRQCLLENATKILAEANRSKFWATGMSTYLTEHTDPDFWPGRNQLGALLMNLATHLLKNSSDNMQPWDNSQSISNSVQVIPDTQENTNHTGQRFGNESEDQPENKPTDQLHEVLPSNGLGASICLKINQNIKGKNPVKHTTKDTKAESTHQCSQRRSQPMHPRPGKHSVHEVHRRGSVDSQDIRTVLAKRKNPASSPDDKTLVRDKIQKSGNGVT